MKTRSITVIARRWFHRGPGNTYHSCEALIDGMPVAKVDFCYGYGNQYEYSAFSALNKAGFCKDWDAQKDSPWRYCERKGIMYHSSVSDVQRKKDL